MNSPTKVTNVTIKSPENTRKALTTFYGFVVYLKGNGRTKKVLIEAAKNIVKKYKVKKVLGVGMPLYLKLQMLQHENMDKCLSDFFPKCLLA